jgi:hypothetical protein
MQGNKRGLVIKEKRRFSLSDTLYANYHNCTQSKVLGFIGSVSLGLYCPADTRSANGQEEREGGYV